MPPKRRDDGSNHKAARPVPLSAPEPPEPEPQPPASTFTVETRPGQVVVRLDQTDQIPRIALLSVDEAAHLGALLTLKSHEAKRGMAG
jgi:hypothetical protein